MVRVLAFFRLVGSIIWLQIVMFALGTLLMVLLFPLVLPFALFLRWIWTA